MAKRSVVFFGSGPVAAESLHLLSAAFTIEAIITKPTTIDMMQAACPSAPLYTVEKRRDLDALVANQKFASACGILIDFGIIVSDSVISAFSKGIINSHFSLLPQWRGADPITFAILSGQKTTGVSIMLLSAGMDEGPLLAQAAYDIPQDATTETLTESLIRISDAALKEVVPGYLDNAVEPAPQETASILGNVAPSYSRKLTKDDGALDWSKPAEQLEREVRAFHGWPKSRTVLAGRDVIVTKAAASTHPEKPGKAYVANKQLLVGCGNDTSLQIIRLKPAGKPEMDAASFLAGYRQFL